MNELNLTKNALKTIVSNIVLQVVNVICGFILPPLLINKYGSEVNGLVTTIRQIITYFSIVSLGLGVSCQTALYKPLNDENYDKINSIMSSATIFFNKTGYIFSLLVASLAFLFPFTVKTDISYITIFLLVIICGIGTICEFIVTNKYKVFLTADQKQYEIAKIQIEGVILNTLVSVIFIYLNFDIIFVQISSTAIYLFRMIKIISYVRRNYPKLKIDKKNNSFDLKDRWNAFYYQASNMIITYTPTIIVAVMCGLIEASIYSIYNMIYQAITMIINVFSSGLSSQFGNLYARKEKIKLEENFKIYCCMYYILLFSLYGVTMIMISSFINIYISNSEGINYVIPLLGLTFSLNGITKNIRIPFTTLVEATGHFKKNGLLNIIEAIFNIVLSISFVWKYGFIYILIGGIVTSLIRSIMYIIYVNKNILQKSSYKDIVIIIFNLITVILMYSIIKINSISLIMWIVYAIFISVIISIILLLINSLINLDNMKKSINKCKNIILRRS